MSMHAWEQDVTQLTSEVGVYFPVQIPAIVTFLHTPVAPLKVSEKHFPSCWPVATHPEQNTAHEETPVSVAGRKGIILHLNPWETHIYSITIRALAHILSTRTNNCMHMYPGRHREDHPR